MTSQWFERNEVEEDMDARKLARRGFVLMTALFAGCATNPATGERMFSLISENQEIEMGQSYAQQVDQSMAMYDDAGLQAYVERIGKELAAVSERPNLPWSFKVVDDPVVNAFALPGGPIYVTRGILAHFNSEAELAAVLGHEIGHITARHSVEQLSRAQLAGLALGVGSIFSEDVRNLAGVASAGLGVLFLSYGRDDEHQSDMLGVRYALRRGYDPREAIDVHEMLGRQTELRGGSGVPSWLSTHPSSADRIDRLRAITDTIAPERLAGTTVGADEFVRQLDGVVYGANPRQGFFRANLFLHPDLEFRLRFPANWETANLSRTVVAQSPAEDAILQLTLASTRGHAAAAQEFFRQEGIRGRNVGATRINGHPATAGRFEARTERGTLYGQVAFIDYGGRTYRILGYTNEAGRSTYDGAFQATIGSFDRLTDPAVLAVQPMRIELMTVQRATTIQQISSTRPSPVPVERLAILNGVQPNDTIDPGRTVKWVVGDRPPGTDGG